MNRPSRPSKIYEHLEATHGTRVCAFRADNGKFIETLFKEEVRYYGQHITYCVLGSYQNNVIVDHMVKEFILGSRTLILHATRLWKE